MSDIDEQELLNLVFQERRNSVGMENDAVLTGERIQALDYYKGDMPDVPSYEGRSKAVSTDVSDAIETALPDLVEIFTGGEDVATFVAHGPQDEDQADQETDYIRHVVNQENPGFLNFYAAFKDALTAKTGVFMWQWEDDERTIEENFEASPHEFELLQQAGLFPDDVEIVNVKQDVTDGGEPVVRYTQRKKVNKGHVRIDVVPPEDFTVARDTVYLKDTTYCAARFRKRAQDLIEEGYDPDLVYALPPYGAPSYSDAVQIARDTAGEQTQLTAGTWGDLRLVEVLVHNIAVVNDDRKREIWRVVTGNDERTLLHVEKLQRVQFSAITPYPQTHRFYGRSLADLLLEIQRIKTAGIRAHLDSLYFALNQRFEVAEQGSNEFTIQDLLLNEPGVPVRSKSGTAVRAITAGGLNVDVLNTLEYFDTAAEKRTGIVRNAQGLNPDTLHDTATGALQLMSNSMRRTRMIARVFAEGGVKDMMLGVHAELREHPSEEKLVKLRGHWVPINPSTWAERDGMEIEIGIGSGGAQHELQIGQLASALVEKLLEAQQALGGQIITIENIYNLAKRMLTKGLNFKGVDRYLTDPKQALQAQQQNPQQPPPNPEMMKLQAQQQMDAQKLQMQQQADAAKFQAQQAADQAKAQSDMQLAQAKLQQDRELKLIELQQNAQLQREQIAADSALKRQEMMLDYQAKLQGAHNSFTDLSQVGREPGGDIGGVAG